MTTPYEQLTPVQIAESDQTLAALASQAKAGEPVIVTIYPTPGDMCCKLDCDQAAAYILCGLYGTPDRMDWPLCTGHYGPWANHVTEIYRDVMGAGA